jgi:hypothetical protein
MAAKEKGAAKPKSLAIEVGGERYRTGVSYLLADDGDSTFLFRALNSNYFVQHQGKTDTIEVLPHEKAEELFYQLPHKHQSVVSAFPKWHGGVGMDTPSAYDDEDEKERLAEGYGVDVARAYVGIEGTPQTASG